MSDGDFFFGCYLVISGFLVSFVLFLRSGPLLQQVFPSERDRLHAFASLTANFLSGRWLRVWPVLQVGVGATYIWARYFSRIAVIDTTVVDACATTSWADLMLVSNLTSNSCFSDLWTISLQFQMCVKAISLRRGG